jgi:hypothetical protein
MKRKILVLIFIHSLWGCSQQLIIKTPISRFESPESSGESQHFGFGFYLQNDVKIQLIDNINDLPPNGNPKIIMEPITPSREYDSAGEKDDPVSTFLFNGKSLTGKGHLGVNDRFDLWLRKSDDAPWLIGAKYQFIGEPLSKAKKKNFSLAATIGLGQDSESQYDGDLKQNEQNELTVLKKVEAESDTFQADVALIAGYRLLDSLLLYSGGHYAYYETEYSVTVVESGNSFNFSNDGSSRGYHMGLMWDLGDRNETICSFSLEYGRASIEWRDFSRSVESLGLGFQFNFL